MAKLTESVLRKIIKEELKKVLMLNENMSLSDIADAIERSGNKDVANRMRQDAHYKKNNGMGRVNLSPSGDGSNLTMSWVDGGQTYYSIPMDVARKAGIA